MSKSIFDSFREGAKRPKAQESNAKDLGFLEVLRSQAQFDCPFAIPTPEQAKYLNNGEFPVGLIGTGL